MWSDRHGWHTVITELSRCTHGWPRLCRGYASGTHEYTWWAHGYSRRLCEYSRFLHGFRGSTTVITLLTVLIQCVLCRRFWYCGRPRKSAVWAVVQNLGSCSTLQCCFFAVMCRQQLKMDNMQSEDVDRPTLFPQSNRTQILQRWSSWL